MSIRKTTLTLALIALALAVVTPAAMAGPARELVTSFGQLKEPAGIAVDLETGDVYVAEPRIQAVDIFNATGGAPAGGVPKQITGLRLNPYLDGVAVDNSCYEHEPRLTGKACEEYDPSYGDVYVTDTGLEEPGGGGEIHLLPNKGVSVFKLNAEGYEQIGEIEASAPEWGGRWSRYAL
jgi:hypothetical protein